MKLVNRDIFNVLDDQIPYSECDEEQIQYKDKYKINFSAVIQNILSFFIKVEEEAPVLNVTPDNTNIVLELVNYAYLLGGLPLFTTKFESWE